MVSWAFFIYVTVLKLFYFLNRKLGEFGDLSKR
jgi:hypothetical protein